MTDSRLLRGKLWKVLPLIAYVCVAVGATYPLIVEITTRLPGGTMDTLVHYWNGWWVRQALRTGQSPFRTSYLFHPRGLTLVYHNFAWINILGWLTLEPLVGGYVAYNLVLLIGLALCGWAAFLLAHELTGSRWAGFVCGLIYQCWPYRTAQLDHPNLVGTYAIPLFLLFLRRAIHSSRSRDGLLAGLFLALAGYARWQLLIPASLVGTVYFLCVLPGRWAARRQWSRSLLLAGAVVAVALAPPALLLLREQQVHPASVLEETDEAALQTDLLAYVTPSPAHPILGKLTAPAYDRYYSDRSMGRRFPAYVGVTTLLLATLGVVGAWPKSTPWLAAAVVLIVLALGMELRVGGQLYPVVPMPYHLASKSFVVRLMRFPDRFSLFLALPVSVLAAFGVTGLFRRVLDRASPRVAGAACLLGSLVVFEFLAVPTPGLDVERSPFYRELAGSGEKSAILNLPINSQSAKRYMFDQVKHQRPIVQGKTARFPEDAYVYLESQPLLRSLRRYGEIDPELADVGRHLTALAADDIGYVLLHKEEADPQQLGRWRRYLLMHPRFEDDRIAAFVTSPVAGRDFTLRSELAPGIGPVEIVTSTGCVEPGGVLEVDVGWGTTRQLTKDYTVELSLQSEEGGTVRRKVYPITPDWPTAEWPESALAWGYHPLRVGRSLTPGSYDVRLSLLDAQTERRSASSLLVGTVRVSDSECEFPALSGGTSVNAVFGDQLWLLGYELTHQGHELQIKLDWRSEQRMEVDYKIFVHVFDRATDAPVAQDDAMPQQWTYPTRFWPAGEMVQDEMVVPLDAVSPGEYGLAMGVYDPETMERLPVEDRTGLVHEDGRLVLPGETVQVEERDS